jgi:hypothetical protein
LTATSADGAENEPGSVDEAGNPTNDRAQHAPIRSTFRRSDDDDAPLPDDTGAEERHGEALLWRAMRTPVGSLRAVPANEHDVRRARARGQLVF